MYIEQNSLPVPDFEPIILQINRRRSMDAGILQSSVPLDSVAASGLEVEASSQVSPVRFESLPDSESKIGRAHV